ncbi:MAG: crossover junction endodeoxyribonuclease RuvC [Verrucomicrobia bacterium]|nr:crossover junction endodeoxyribonuclease RuvC [Verrucomicrobiota bacterium]
MKLKRILGVDPGTRVTGWGVVEMVASRYRLVAFGVITPKVSLTMEQKYLEIFEGITVVIDAHLPEALSIETQYVDKNVQSAIKLGMARGTAIVAAAKKGLPVFEYSPTNAKKAVTGRGSATKEQVAQMLKLLLGIQELTMPEDASDALALALAHMHRKEPLDLLRN